MPSSTVVKLTPDQLAEEEKFMADMQAFSCARPGGARDETAIAVHVAPLEKNAPQLPIKPEASMSSNRPASFLELQRRERPASCCCGCFQYLSRMRRSRLDDCQKSSVSTPPHLAASLEALPAKWSRRPSQNSNRISDYRWLEEPLKMIVEGDARGRALGANGQEKATPIFAVAGACPSTFAPMQAMMFSSFGDTVDFWWAKPHKEDIARFDMDYLQLHDSGPLKNVPELSRAVYQPLAAMFGEAITDGFAFSIDESGRAIIEETSQDGQGNRRMHLFLIWMEEWSSGTFGYGAFVRGKICYQMDGRFFARQYSIEDDKLSIAPAGLFGEDEEFMSILPPDSFQDMFCLDPDAVL